MAERKIRDLKGNCCLVAIKEITRLPDEQIIQVCEDHDYSPKSGMRPIRYTQALRVLGFKTEDIKVRNDSRYDRDAKVTITFPVYGHKETRYGKRIPGRDTIAKFAAEHSEGVYVVATDNHAVVVRDGVVIDHNIRAKKSRKHVRSAIRVTDAPIVEAPKYVQVVVWHRKARNPKSEASLRYTSMVTCMHRAMMKDQKVTPAELHALTSYRPADLAYDVRKGNVRMVD